MLCRVQILSHCVQQNDRWPKGREARIKWCSSICWHFHLMWCPILCDFFSLRFAPFCVLGDFLFISEPLAKTRPDETTLQVLACRSLRTKVVWEQNIAHHCRPVYNTGGLSSHSTCTYLEGGHGHRTFFVSTKYMYLPMFISTKYVYLPIYLVHVHLLLIEILWIHLLHQKVFYD